MQTLPKQPFYRKLFIFAALLAFFTWYGLGRLDPDFGWHLQAGRDILAHGIPKTDLYTYTARDFPWIDHEWLSDVLLAWLFASGGWALVNLIYAGIWSLALWLAGKRHDLLVLSLAVLAIYGYSGVRQLAWTTLLFVIARRLLQKPGRRNYLIVPLMLVWANLHGGFILGLAVLAGNWFTRRTWRNLMLGAVSFGMTFINPYGWRIYIEIFRTLFDPALHRFISEWQILNWTFTTWAFLSLSLAVYWVTERRHLQSAFSWRGLTLVMAISSTRNMVLFIVVWMEDLEERLSQLYPQIRQAVPRKQRLLALTLVPVLLLIGLSVYALSRQTPDPERNMPYQAVAYLQAHPCQGHIFNDYGYGGYLIWRLPSTPVYIDGRMPSWETNGTTWVQRYNKVQTDVSFRETEFKNYNITCALLIRQSIGQELYKWLQDQGWEVKIKTDHSVLLVKPS